MNLATVLRCLLVSVVLLPPLLAVDRIGDIEFFGYKGLDTSRIRSELPVHEGDAYLPDTKTQVQEAVTRVLGKAPTDVAAICCDEQHNYVVFIGLPGSSNKGFTYKTQPQGGQRLSPDIVDVYKKLDAAIEAAVRRDAKSAQEDDSNGYSLINEPGARALQLRVHDWALNHQKELLQVLMSSSSVENRRIATDAPGYGPQNDQQVSALVHAARDPDDEVRNNATRALGVLVRAKPTLSAQIPAETFIEMLNAGIWTDRNKGASLLMALTRDRRQGLLQQIRSAALDSLIEMAAWRDTSHAYFSRIILGRIAGIPEDRLGELAWKGPVSSIIDAARATSTATPPKTIHD